MSIGAVCPHCDLTLQLQPEMVGRSIRCPNPECRETFVVPPTFAELVPTPKPILTAKQILTAKPVQLPAKPKEVRWSEDLERPIEKPAPKPLVRKVAILPEPEIDLEPTEPIRSQPKRSNRSPMLLAGLSVLLLLGIVGLGVYYFIQTQRAEQRLLTEAEAAYTGSQFAESAKKYKQLGDEYPESERKPRYDFFAKLAANQGDAQRMGASVNPNESLDSLIFFTLSEVENPLAKPGTGFGADLVQVGQRLANAAHDFAAAEVKQYKFDRSHIQPLRNAEDVVSKARQLLAGLERFRDKDSPPSKELLQKFDVLTNTLSEERRRSEALADWRTALQTPTQAKIEQFLDAMQGSALAEDEETLAMVAAARKVLLSQIRYVEGRIAAIPHPADVAQPQLSTLPIPGSPRPKPPLNSKEETCFGIAGGCLFACDAHTGDFLWGRRVAPPTAKRATVDLPVRASLSDSKDGVLVVGIQRAGGAGVAALKIRTGEAIWFQPLSAPCYARPAIIGTHLFVGLSDDAGTIIEFDLASGERLGSISLQQPLGANLQMLPGVTSESGFLVAVCRSQRVILLETGRENSKGELVPISYVRSHFTGHAAGANLIDPLIVAAAAPVEPTSLFLAFAAGPANSNLVEYRLPSRKVLGGVIVDGEIAAPRIAEKFAGWPWYPSMCDGERLALATDAGRLHLFGITGKTNGLYSLINENAKGAGESISRACVVALDDDSLWAIVNEHLVQYKSSVNNQGYRTVPTGKPRRVGEAAMRPQLLGSANLGIVGVLSSPTERVQLLAFDLDTGEPRWHVELKSEEIK